MKPIDATLPMPAGDPVHVTELLAPPADRAELLDVLTRITQEAKMPPGVKHARFVRVPADLYLAAHDMVRRELADLAGSEQ